MFGVEEFDVTHNLGIHFKALWGKTWLDNKPQIDYKNHLGFSHLSFCTTHFNRSDEKIINRLRLFTCGLNAYLYKLGVKETNLCDVCGVVENVEHFLLHCTKHVDLHRNVTALANSLNMPINIGSILNNNMMLKLVISYVYKNNIKL